MSKPPPRSFMERLVQRRAGEMHKVVARDSRGHWAWYLVHVRPEREAAFLRATEDKVASLELTDYGEVIASCYGREPTAQVRAMLKERYGFYV